MPKLSKKKVAEFTSSAYSSSNDTQKELVSVEEYRAILNDRKSTDEQIKKRLTYLEALCRNVIKLELKQ